MAIRHCFCILFACFFLVASATALPAQTLSIDIDDRDSAAQTQPGFESFLIDGTGIQTGSITRSYGGIDVTMMNVGATGYDDRLRAEPVDADPFTESLLLRDFVFARNAAGRGINVQLSGLEPWGVYNGSIWSFDDGSGGARISDWLANGRLVKEGYMFNGNDVPPSPASNDAHRFGFSFTASPAGEVTLKGQHRAGGFGVFLNALQVDHVETMSFNPDPVLSIDFGSGTAGDGFTQMNLAASGSQVEGKTITVSPVGAYDSSGYDVYVNFWSADGAQNWPVAAGLAEDTMEVYNKNNSPSTGRVSGNRMLYQGHVGRAIPNESGEVEVFIDDIVGTHRTWLDSLGVQSAATPGDPVELIQIDDTNTVGTVSGAADWHATPEDATHWFGRSGYDETFSPVWQGSAGAGRDNVGITTTLTGLEEQISSIPVTLDERNRALPVDAGAFDQQGLLQDFIFASNGDAGTSGLDVLIEDLQPNAEYWMTVWAFDDSSGAERRSDWFANGELINENYRFDGTLDPQTNDDYRFGGMVTTDQFGQILLEGRVNGAGAAGASSPNVFLNAIQLHAVPEPSSLAMLLAVGLFGAVTCWLRRRS